MYLSTRVLMVAGILVVGQLAGCATFEPVPLDQVPFRERALQEEQDGLRVKVSILNAAESEQVFSANLYKNSIQPVWLEIENKTEKPFWFVLHGLDPAYFSAREVAYINHARFSGTSNRQMDEYFSAMGIQQSVLPGETQSGFAFTNAVPGTREVRIQLYGDKDIRYFDFFVSVPGQTSDWDAQDLSAIYSEAQLVRTNTADELRQALLSLPCCTAYEFGSEPGEPLNVVIIGETDAVKALVKAGWDESAFSRELSTLFDAALYQGRSPDIQFEKSRRRIDSTAQLRLWLSPIQHRDKGVLIGTVRRSKDPDIDDATLYLLEDLAIAQTVKQFGFVKGFPSAERSKPRTGIGIRKYFTDGNRMVIEMSASPVKLQDILVFDWDWLERLSGETASTERIE